MIDLTFSLLDRLGLPALPVAPAQPADKYPSHDKEGQIKLDRDGNPIPAFTGKNPSHLDQQGRPHPINHRVYQDRLPTEAERLKWWANPANGIGTLGGWGGIYWIDLDLKQFDSQEDCDAAFQAILAKLPGKTWTEKTHSGGYRIAVKLAEEPGFTNFAQSPGGKHVGEVLGRGRFTVLASTIGPSGNPYLRLSDAEPVEIESLESIEIYSSKKLKTQQPVKTAISRPMRQYSVSIDLAELGNEASSRVLAGEDIKGDRSESLATAIQEWAGWLNWCQRNGIQVSGSVEELATEAGERLGIDADRVGRILASVDTAACQPAAELRGGDEACWKKIDRLKGWRQESSEAETRKAGRPRKVVPIRPDIDSLLTPDQTAAELTELLRRNLSPSKMKAAKIELRLRTQIGEREFNDLCAELETERCLESERDGNLEELENLLKISNYDLKMTGILHPVTASLIEQAAELIGSTGAAMLLTLLPAVATLCRVGTRLELIPATGFSALPILYTGICAESGSSKSPTQKIILKSLLRLQTEEEDRFKERIEQWEEDCKQAKENDEPVPDKPSIREYYTVDVTREAIAQIQSQQPERGFLGWSDELSAVFGSQGQYKNGRGTDREALLSGRDGTGLKVNRASGKRISTPISAYSITGGTQPDTLRKLMGDFSDGSGQWARFLWTCLPLKRAPFPRGISSAPFDDLQTILYSIYRTIEDLPAQTYRLSAQAEQVYADWYDELDEQRYTGINQAFRSCHAKAKGNTGEIALLLHILNAATVGTVPEEEISKETILSAIKVIKFCLGQVKLIHSMGEADQGELSPVLAKIIELAERKGSITAKDAKTGISVLRCDKKATADRIRGSFQELVAIGYGSIQGEGSSLTYSSKTTVAEPEPQETGDTLSPVETAAPSLPIETEKSSTDATRAAPTDSELVDQYCRAIEAAAKTNGHSREALTELVEQMRPLSRQVKQEVWQRLPKQLAARIQREIIGKPLRGGGAA